MDTDDRGFPRGDLRVSDADRDRALAELSAAVQAGRITAGEFDQRSGQALSARTGSELAAPLADLPVGHAPADVVARPRESRPPARVAIAAAVAATCFGAVAVANALRPEPTLQQRELMQQLMARQGISVPLPPSPGFDWGGTLTPGAIAVLLVVLVILLHVARARRA
jgi:Domain of unknown function (DUF1707)